jgi:hypothetical protein
MFSPAISRGKWHRRKHQHRHKDLIKCLTIFLKQGFDQLLLRSIRGIGYKQERNILQSLEHNPEIYRDIIKIIKETVTESSVIETYNQAVFIGEKTAQF